MRPFERAIEAASLDTPPWESLGGLLLVQCLLVSLVSII
jgi:hypothetical protein